MGSATFSTWMLPTISSVTQIPVCAVELDAFWLVTVTELLRFVA